MLFQVTIKEEKLEELDNDMWRFKDVIVGEVLNILLHWIQNSGMFFRSRA